MNKNEFQTKNLIFFELFKGTRNHQIDENRPFFQKEKKIVPNHQHIATFRWEVGTLK